IPVAFFSIEMGKDNLIQRLICSRAKVDYMKMRSGYLSESDWVPLTTAAGNLSGVPLFINDFSTPTAIEITGMARKMVLYKGVKLVVIDFLQQIYHSDKKSETQQVTDDVKLIKGLAKSLNVPVILLSSLSRRTNFKEPPTLSLLRQSGAIESVADTVMFVYRQEEYSPTPENRGIAEIHIKKQRNGPTGVVTLAFIKQFTRFENLAYQKELTYDETL
ncbi:MAG: DnaB-like helicase C-terminal domain-containing protein, partial [Candidatus Omnitrophica bacterium]|nr:DnaB-like helicase C-terminal domain-containing protein [Candidatus Omnitrophota bacterium]